MNEKEKQKILNTPATTSEIIDSLRHMGNDHPCCKPFCNMAADRIQDILTNLKKFNKIMNAREESSFGREFSPTTISSCRTQHIQELGEIFDSFKNFTKEIGE